MKLLRCQDYLSNLAGIDGSSQSMVVNDAPSGYVDDAGTLLDLAESIIIEHALQDCLCFE